MESTTLRVPDSTENRAHPGGQDTRWDSTSGDPLARLTTLMALRSHLLAGVRVGAHTDHETVRVLAGELSPMIPNHSLAIVDRGFLSARIVIGLERGGIAPHWLARARSDLASTRTERFATGDERLE